MNTVKQKREKKTNVVDRNRRLIDQMSGEGKRASGHTSHTTHNRWLIQIDISTLNYFLFYYFIGIEYLFNMLFGLVYSLHSLSVSRLFKVPFSLSKSSSYGKFTEFGILLVSPWPSITLLNSPLARTSTSCSRPVFMFSVTCSKLRINFRFSFTSNDSA